MDSKLIQPFVDETIRTFALMVGLTPKKTAAAEKAAPASVHDISGMVGVSGTGTGGIVLSLPEKVACEVVSRILCEPIHELTPDVKDGVGELVNIISARSKRALSKLGFPDLKLLLPSVVVGKGHTVWRLRDLPCVSVNFVIEGIGPFCIEVSIRPARKRRAMQAAVAEGAGEYGPGTALRGADTGEGQAAMKILLVDDSVMFEEVRGPRHG